MRAGVYEKDQESSKDVFVLFFCTVIKYESLSGGKKVFLKHPITIT